VTVSGPASSAGRASIIWKAKISPRLSPRRSRWRASRTAKIPHLITVGFGRQTLLGAADTLIDLVSREKLRHIFLVGGCDGRAANVTTSPISPPAYRMTA
jgi:hydroxylamine reductase (hybrid-cluster protein)